MFSFEGSDPRLSLYLFVSSKPNNKLRKAVRKKCLESTNSVSCASCNRGLVVLVEGLGVFTIRTDCPSENKLPHGSYSFWNKLWIDVLLGVEYGRCVTALAEGFCV